MIVIAVALFAIGIYAGFLITKNSVVIQNTATNVQPQAITQNPLTNPLISSVFAIGQLASVSGTTIVISSGSNTLTITTNASTKIVAYKQSAKDANGNITVTPQNITLGDLKTGDYLNINFKVSSSGQLVATSISKISN